jgi:uncharacterized membrane protein
MATFESSKILAGIGSLLYGVPIIGVVLMFIGMKGLSEHYKDNRIFDGLITGAVLLIISSILSLIGLSALWTGVATIWFGVGFIVIIGALVCFVISFILALLAVRYVRNCFHALADRSGENLFRTAGTLIWIGAILSIIGVGYILIWIGFIIAAVGFFTLKDNQSTPTYGYTQPPNTQPPPTTSAKANFCPNCGTSVAPEATFCSNCGKQI